MNIRYDAAGRIERLLDKPVWLVDLLPRQVPAESPGQYFAVEAFWQEGPEGKDLYRRFLRVILKLNCYHQFDVYYAGCWSHSPSPKILAQQILHCASRNSGDHINILLDGEEAMLVLDGGDLYFVVHSDSDEVLGLISELAAAEGLYFRRAPV